MTATVDDFKQRFPELSDGSNDPAIQTALEEAAISNTLSACPKFADLLQLYYAAHDIYKSSFNPEGMDESIGPVTSTTVGQMSQSNKVSSNSVGAIQDYFNSSPYGTKYLYFLKKCTGGAAMVAP